MSSETGEENEEFFDALEDSISIVSRSSASSISRPKDPFPPAEDDQWRLKDPRDLRHNHSDDDDDDVMELKDDHDVKELKPQNRPRVHSIGIKPQDDPAAGRPAADPASTTTTAAAGAAEGSQGLRDPAVKEVVPKAEEIARAGQGGKPLTPRQAATATTVNTPSVNTATAVNTTTAVNAAATATAAGGHGSMSRTSSLSDWNPNGPMTSDLDINQIPAGPLAYFDENGEFVLMLKNLDTGEYVPLKQVEEELNRHALDPVTLSVLRRLEEEGGEFPLTTTESEPDSQVENDQEETEETSQVETTVLGMAKQKTKNLWEKFKSKATKSLDEVQASSDEEEPSAIKYIKTNTHDKSKKEYNRLLKVQDLAGHTGPVWAVKFSVDGKFLATGGQDTVLRIWGLITDPQAPVTGEREPHPNPTAAPLPSKKGNEKWIPSAIFHSTPLLEFKGHTADILDVSWSKNNFIISSSMDKTVRLWHLTRKEALCVFQHNDFVTSVSFHPLDDRFFLSGSMDGKLRIWNIPEKKVAFWNETPGSSIITAVNFTAAGDVALAGTYLGVLFFYETQGLTYMTQINVTTSRGKTRSKKITGIDNVPGEEQILVSSNDSRLRQYHLNDKSLSCKFRGNVNMYSQIRASFRDDGAYVVCGSEDQKVYIWSATPELPTNPGMFSGFRRDRNKTYESFQAHSEVVTAAVFAPSSVKRTLEETQRRIPAVNALENSTQGDIIVSADYSGVVRVFENDRIRHHKSNSSLGKTTGGEMVKELDSLRPRSQSGSEAAASSAVPPTPLSIPGTPSVSESGHSSLAGTPTATPVVETQKWMTKLSFPGFPKGKEKENQKEHQEPQKEPVCPNCGGKNLKTFGLVADPKKKKKKDEFRACLDCDISWKI